MSLLSNLFNEMKIYETIKLKQLISKVQSFIRAKAKHVKIIFVKFVQFPNQIFR